MKSFVSLSYVLEVRTLTNVISCGGFTVLHSSLFLSISFCLGKFDLVGLSSSRNSLLTVMDYRIVVTTDGLG